MYGSKRRIVMGSEAASSISEPAVLQIPDLQHQDVDKKTRCAARSIARFGTRTSSGKQARRTRALPLEALPSGHLGIHPQRPVQLDTIAFTQGLRQGHPSAPDAAGQVVIRRQRPTLLASPFQSSTHIGRFRQVDFSLKNLSGRRREQESDFHWRSRLRHHRPDRPA